MQESVSGKISETSHSAADIPLFPVSVKRGMSAAEWPEQAFSGKSGKFGKRSMSAAEWPEQAFTGKSRKF